MQCGVRDLLAPSSQEGWKALAANGPMQTDVVILHRAVADHRFLVSKKTVILGTGAQINKNGWVLDSHAFLACIFSLEAYATVPRTYALVSTSLDSSTSTTLDSRQDRHT